VPKLVVYRELDDSAIGGNRMRKSASKIICLVALAIPGIPLLIGALFYLAVIIGDATGWYRMENSMTSSDH